MGKKQKEYQRLLDQLEAQLAQARNPSQYEQNLSADYTRNRGWLLGGKYKNAQDIGAFTNLSPVANTSREMQLGMGGPMDNMASGTSGNPLAMHGQELRRDSDTNKMWGGAYENTLNQIQGNQEQLFATGQNAYNDRMQKGIEGAQQLASAYAARPRSRWRSFGLGLLQAGIGVGGSLLGGLGKKK